MQRITIIGVTGSGKTTLGRKLNQQLLTPFFDLDDINWGPNWSPIFLEEFRAKVDQITIQERWILSGNYRKVRDLIWPRADTLIWLDYSFPLVFVRLWQRTINRILSGELVCNGNHETWRAIFGRDSLVLWQLKTYWKRKREIPHELQQLKHNHLNTLRFRSQKQTDLWLASLPKVKH